MSRLFAGASILEVIPRQRIQSLDGNAVLNASEEDLVQSLVQEFSAQTPDIDESRIYVDLGEQQIDLSQDPTRFIRDRSKAFHVQGTRVTFIIPFSGDASWLQVQPQNFTYSSSGSNAVIVGSEIHITYSGLELNGERAKASFDNELRLFKVNLSNLKSSIDRYNAGLDAQVRSQVKQRKTKLLADSAMASSLGFPIKRREGAPATFAVPVQRRRPKVAQLTSSTVPYKPEPALAVTEYNNILNIIQNMVRVMEQSPQAFAGMGEEDLRTHFLVQLNGQYEGTATGETFNFQGKTDIIIKVEGKNVFIAECKFWGGEKQLLATLDQLLSYLSWRDTKAAVIVFNRNLNFTDVLRKISSITLTHPLYKRTLPPFDETTFKYIFGQANDVSREVTVTVMAFDVPKNSYGG